ncbi:MAG TPA: iron-containing redox enzyme family protein [Drouetiella sp.]
MSVLVKSAAGEQIKVLALKHACASHPLFAYLHNQKLNLRQVAAMLRNYDAHASVLRRLLLKAVVLMPEPAVGFILENVRNEYGNGDFSKAHQWQLKDLAQQTGITDDEFNSARIEPGIRKFIQQASKFYDPKPATSAGFLKAAVSAGAITATEILALEEFKALQIAFRQFNLQHHIWFDHVAVEAEHTDESIQLADYFINKHNAQSAVEHGLNGVLDANVYLYDGLLSAMVRNAD